MTDIEQRAQYLMDYMRDLYKREGETKMVITFVRGEDRQTKELIYKPKNDSLVVRECKK